MLWYVLLGVAVTLVALSLVIPTTRRVWTFHVLFVWYVPLRALFSALQLRRLAALLTGTAYEPYSGPAALRHFCEAMGPTFIKLGQIVASSAGMFPERYSQEFQKCLDRVRPFSFALVQQTIARELGPTAFDKIRDIDSQPLASASIAQVHTAKLDDGSEVVVKVQRPGLDARVAADMRILKWAARLAARFLRDAELANPVGIVEDFSATLAEELDFTKEAANLDRFNTIQRELNHNDVRAPNPHWDLTTRQVLVMERFYGIRVDRIPESGRELDAEGLLIKGMRSWFQSVLFYGFFHGDVHAGNLMVLDNGDVGFLDFGIVGRFDDERRRLVTDYMVAFSTGDYAALARVVAAMGGVGDGVDLGAFAADLEKVYAPVLTMQMSDFNLADFLPSVQRVASKHRMTMPREFVLITKQMLYFDRYAKILAPKLNVFTDPRLLFSLMSDIKRARDQFQAEQPTG